jgi:hypothetical protein
LNTSSEHLPILHSHLVDTKIVKSLTETTGLCIFTLLTLNDIEGYSVAEETIELLTDKLIGVVSLCGIKQTLFCYPRELVKVIDDDNVYALKGFIVSTARKDLI